MDERSKKIRVRVEKLSVIDFLLEFLFTGSLDTDSPQLCEWTLVSRGMEGGVTDLTGKSLNVLTFFSIPKIR